VGKLTSKLAHAWNAFNDRPVRDQFDNTLQRSTPTYSSPPHQRKLNTATERSIIASLFTRMAIDFCAIDFRHVRLDDQKRYTGEMDSELNNCLTVEANLDENSRAFFFNAAMTMFDKGVMALVPFRMTLNPNQTTGFDVQAMRVGEIVAWQPQAIIASVYNEETGRKEDIPSLKSYTPIVQNPFYAVMNEPNSTLSRLIRKLNLLDQVDDASSSGKLDLIIQLPYVIKHEAQMEMAQKRRQDIEDQLRGSSRGIAYTDGTEKIVQLNRPVENNLMGQVEYLMGLLYEQLGLTKGVMDGTADEAAMLNYYERAIKPLVELFMLEMHRKFLSKTARTQGQAITYFRDPFRLVPISQLAEIADKFTRNEIATSNEFRQVIGWKPVLDDPKADQLRNSNMPESELGIAPSADTEVVDAGPDPFDAVNQALDSVFQELGVAE
jgi:hypothetical protein